MQPAAERRNWPAAPAAAPAQEAMAASRIVTRREDESCEREPRITGSGEGTRVYAHRDDDIIKGSDRIGHLCQKPANLEKWHARRAVLPDVSRELCADFL